jgi:quinol monooxygenase YgiN/predicted enzyme related to lactoylglutathione lyase
MYGLIGRMKAVPGQRDALAAILMAGTSEARMPGCHSYVVADDPTDPDALWITEVWDSRESHAASLALPAVQAAIAAGRPLIAGFAERFETEPVGGVGSSHRPESPSSAREPIRLHHATPILRVADYDASLAYYLDVLGFAIVFSIGRFGCVTRGDASIMLCEGSQGNPGTWLYVGVSDADALHDELRERGARIRNPPMNFPWGSRELHVLDPDGHVLRMGAEARPGDPLGIWLDDDGVRWQAHEDHSWTRVEATPAE